ncbi:MAG: oligosaccharide flippase family protein, partial [Planctomycetota bacterium]
MKPDRFDESAGPLFAWASIFGLSTAALTVGFGLSLPFLPTQFDRFRVEGLFAVLLVLAVQTAIRPVTLLGRMRLSVNLEFASLARLDAGLALLRICLTWIVAREGGGVLALAVPLAAGTLIEAIGLGFMGGFRKSDFVPGTWHVRQLWPALAWPLAFAVMNSLRADILFLIVGFIVPATVLGVFYFAYQLANQPTMFIGSALQNVLAPLSARDRGDSDAERRSIERILATSMLFVPVTTMAAASFFPSAERLLWGGKWESAAPSLYWLCAAATYSTVALLLVGSLLGLQ